MGVRIVWEAVQEPVVLRQEGVAAPAQSPPASTYRTRKAACQIAPSDIMTRTA